MKERKSFKELRESKKLTQEKLACVLGVRQSTVSMWESGKSKPKLKDVLKIAKALRTSAAEVTDCFSEV